MTSWSIGKSVQRKEALEKVTGAAKYTADYSAPNMLHVKLVVSSYAHAKLKKVDVTKAWQVPGVRAIVLGQQFPLMGSEVKDRPIIAFDKVRYHGEPIAAVVADHPVQAKKAAELIEVTYEPLTVINAPKEALLPDAPLLHEDLALYEKIHMFTLNRVQTLRIGQRFEKGISNKHGSIAMSLLRKVFHFPLLTLLQWKRDVPWQRSSLMDLFISHQPHRRPIGLKKN